MEEYELIVDEKVSVWKRSRIFIEAESLDEAVKDCAEYGIDNASRILDSEYIYETEENIEPSDLNTITIEVMDNRYTILGNNRNNSVV